MAEGEFIIRLINGGGDSGSGGASGGGKSGGMSLGGFGAKLGAALSVGTDIYGLLKDAVQSIIAPAMGLIKGIMRLLAEFLRPVADMMFNLLRPVLVIIQPMVALFKSFMAPFINIARQFGDLATRLAAPGPNQNIGGAMEAGIQGFMALLGPFIVSITSVGLQLASTLVVGAISAIMNTIVDIVESAVKFITPGEWLDPVIEETFNGIRTSISDAGQNTIQMLNSAVTTGTVVILDAMQGEFETKLNGMKARFPGLIHDALVVPPEGAASELQRNLTDTFTQTKDNVVSAVNTLGTSVDTKMGPGGTIINDFQTALNSMEDAAWNFHGKLVDVADEIRQIRMKAEKESKRSKFRISGGIEIG